VSDVITAADAARAAIAAAEGGEPVAVAAAWRRTVRWRRMLIDEQSVAHGTLGDCTR
jgi:hypothetical protein